MGGCRGPPKYDAQADLLSARMNKLMDKQPEPAQDPEKLIAIDYAA